MPPVLTLADVPRLLAESRQHQLTRIRLGNKLTGKQHTPAYREAEQASALALTTRLQAHDLDPEHTSPAWALDTAPHERIVDFLTIYPAIP